MKLLNNFLTKEGKKIIQEFQGFQFIFLIKETDAYVFTSEVNYYKNLRREAITKDVNKVMRVVSKQLPGQPNVTSHSFRIDYITQLWKDSKDKCAIGFLLLFVIFRPISYEEFEQRNQFVRQEVLILRAGGQDSTDRISVGRKILQISTSKDSRI